MKSSPAVLTWSQVAPEKQVAPASNSGRFPPGRAARMRSSVPWKAVSLGLKYIIHQIPHICIYVCIYIYIFFFVPNLKSCESDFTHHMIFCSKKNISAPNLLSRWTSKKNISAPNLLSLWTSKKKSKVVAQKSSRVADCWHLQQIWLRVGQLQGRRTPAVR